MGWWLEKIDPTTPAEFGREAQPRFLVLLKFFLALPIVAGLYWLIWYFRAALPPFSFGLALVGVPPYLVLSHLYHPNVDELRAGAEQKADPLRDYTPPENYALAVWWITRPGAFAARAVLDLCTLLRHVHR